MYESEVESEDEDGWMPERVEGEEGTKSWQSTDI